MGYRRATVFVFGIVMILFGQSVLAQKKIDTVKTIPGIEIRSSVDIAEAYIGDPITYQVTIVHDSSLRLIPPPLGANLGAFDVKDYQADVQTKLKDGRIQNQTTFVLSTFTVGNYVIPPLPVAFMLPDSSLKVMMAEGLPIKIKSLLENAGDSVDIHQLKGPYEFKRNLIPYYIWGGVILLLLAAALFLWLRLRRRKGIEEVVDLRPAWEIAFEKLAMLKEKRLLEDGNHKQFYIELTDIVRGFLERMYGIAVLDMTTSEFLDQFSVLQLPDGLEPRVASFLHHADLVKFAKYVPETERSIEEYQIGHDIIETVRMDYQRRQQTQVHISAESPAAGTPTTGGNA